MISLLGITIDENTKPQDLERIRRNIVDAVTEVQRLPVTSTRQVSNVSLADAVSTPVAHGLGRRPLFVSLSVIRGATSTGRIVETSRDDRFVYLTATGHGATITVDLEIK